uniref:F-box/LRR-repeat protein 15/At3g58940/PEG3-like LRR domain-containing protein n=1 Tax=Aegilops tauschii subsp. strangulata TaxID=200361 RepID=A0A453E4P4_AEGTS
MVVVSKILSSHPGPARRLDIRMFSTNCNVQAKFDEWFLSPALDQLEELSFEAGRCRSLPPSALRLTPMLRRASFSSCYLPQINAAPALLLPQLKQLDLFDVGISKQAMEHLLRNCTALEYLRLQQIHGFISLHIASTNLRWIYVSCWPRKKTSIGKRSLQLFHVMVIENAPFLERLLVSDLEGPTKIRVIDAPKLTVLVYSSAKFFGLFIGSVIVQVQHSSSSPSS